MQTANKMEDKMKFNLKRLTAIALTFALVTGLVFGTTILPAYAQAEDGLLNDMGEGDNRILSSEWRTLTPGQQITYQFNYDGDDTPVSVWMNAIPADGAIFQIWTDDRLAELADDGEAEPLGQGTTMTEGSGFTNWQGGSPEAGTYYVVVSSTSENTVRFLLNVSSPALSGEQPGAIAMEPVPPPAQPVDPNIAVVTTDALNVRSGPSTAFPVLLTVPNGTQMTVLGRNAINTWINVQLEDGTEGWVTRSLTSYALVNENIIVPEALPAAATSVAATITTTSTAPIAATTPITPSELGDGWQVLSPGEADWYAFQYRGGDLPLTIWMDVEPFAQATFTVVSAETAQAMMAGTLAAPTSVIGSGRSNPVEPGYLFWQANFDEADTFYVMVQPTANAGGDVLYSIQALGPGVGRVITPVE